MLNIKAHQQQIGFCGPASLKMVLHFYGAKHSEEELGELSGCTPEKGVTAFALLRAARKVGFSGFVRDYSRLRDIRSFLVKKIPVIVEWFSQTDPHFSVVIKIDDEYIYLQDPEVARIRKMKIETFRRIWFAFDSQGETIRKKEDLVLRRMVVIERK